MSAGNRPGGVRRLVATVVDLQASRVDPAMVRDVLHQHRDRGQPAAAHVVDLAGRSLLHGNEVAPQRVAHIDVIPLAGDSPQHDFRNLATAKCHELAVQTAGEKARRHSGAEEVEGPHADHVQAVDRA